MDSAKILQLIHESGPLFFVLLSAAILSLIWEWTANNRRDDACEGCADCAQRRHDLASERKRQRAKRTRMCPNDGWWIPNSGECPKCQTKYW